MRGGGAFSRREGWLFVFHDAVFIFRFAAFASACICGQSSAGSVPHPSTGREKIERLVCLSGRAAGGLFSRHDNGRPFWGGPLALRVSCSTTFLYVVWRHCVSRRTTGRGRNRARGRARCGGAAQCRCSGAQRFCRHVCGAADLLGKPGDASPLADIRRPFGPQGSLALRGAKVVLFSDIRLLWPGVMARHCVYASAA